MSSRQRIVLLLIAAVVLVAGILIAASSGGDDDSDNPETTATPAQTTPSSGGTTATTEAPPEPRVDVIRIKAGAPIGGAKTLEWDRGDTIRLRFVSDKPGEVHIHGYDKELELSGGGAQTVSFKANLEGIFEIEDHDTEALLAKLEVRPK